MSQENPRRHFFRTLAVAGAAAPVAAVALVSGPRAASASAGACAPTDLGDVRCFGAIGDGTAHYLEDHFADLAAAQAVYPRAVDLRQTLDWAGIQKALDEREGVFVPEGEGVVLTAPGGGRFRVTVDDRGNLSSTHLS